MIKLKELLRQSNIFSSFHFLEPTKIPPSKKDVLKGGEEEEQEELEEKRIKSKFKDLVSTHLKLPRIRLHECL